MSSESGCPVALDDHCASTLSARLWRRCRNQSRWSTGAAVGRLASLSFTLFHNWQRIEIVKKKKSNFKQCFVLWLCVLRIDACCCWRFSFSLDSVVYRLVLHWRKLFSSEARPMLLYWLPFSLYYCTPIERINIVSKNASMICLIAIPVLS